MRAESSRLTRWPARRSSTSSAERRSSSMTRPIHWSRPGARSPRSSTGWSGPSSGTINRLSWWITYPCGRRSSLTRPDRKTVAELASRLGEEHKWLTPRELEDAKVSHKGQTTAFMEWVASLDEQKQKFDANPGLAERLTETERRAIDAGRRLMTYKAYSGDEMRSAGIVRVMPRPFSFKALGYVTQVIKNARESKSLRDLAPIEFDTLKALDTYWNDIPRDQRVEPGENAQLDEKFSAWLRDSSAWVPLKVLLKAKPENLVEAGYPEAEVNAFLADYR